MNCDQSQRKDSHLHNVAHAMVRVCIDVSGHVLFWNYDPRKTIVVAGSPRGGTTWLAESLSSSQGHILIWEPLEPSSHHGILKRLGADYDPYMPLGYSPIPGEWQWKLHKYLKRVMTGRVPLSDYMRRNRQSELPLLDFLQFRRLIVKFVRGNMLFHWLLQTYQCPGVLILRHPCAVIASQMHFAWKNPLSWKNRWRSYLEQNSPHLIRVVDSITTGEEVLALDWAITNLTPLQQNGRQPWVLTTYEDLLEDRSEWQRVCDALGCPVPDVENIQKLSSTYKPRSGQTSEMTSTDKWRKHLSQDQVQRILRICREVGVDFYDENPYPKNLDRYHQTRSKI